MDAPYPPEWLMERNAIHLPVVGQPIVAAYNLGPDTPPNNQTLVRGFHFLVISFITAS